ncbi:phospholipase D family protein [Methylobacterium sp. SyP6R]|uniref:phospholipase D family protein n=1 Tax=Methylobacterium sp. SyP6R TaxID=2718876 RepID=UPI001F19DC7A|nr:phospholipase D family protein [Methylobacterium sp. SyP6R]MCF4130047.1 phospholipase D family protein [Methylobacterium sp. SyP6R]
MSTSRPWRGQPYLDELRPAPGWDVDLALFATYSLDLSALGAALLALCGRNDGNGSGSIADFAQAVEALRGRARFMVQRGRIARPSRLPVLAGILDQFVVEIPYDEERRSWHPKAALVRYACDRGTMWRLWLGSRNLTRSADLDVGLLLESTTGRRKGGRRVAGIGTVGQLLAGRSGLPDLNVDAVVVELEAARWLSPEGVEVTRIDVADEGAGMRQAPAQGSFDAITVVSPFLDATFLRRVGAWGDEGTRRTLVSTRQALTAAAQARSSPLHRFDRILALDAPIPPLDVADDAASPAPLDDADPQTPSLHAKLFCFERNGKATLLVGSANATSRAWEGRNAELLAELTGGAALTEGLGHLTGSASPVAFADLKEAPPAEPGPREALELLRRRLVGAWSPRLVRDGPAFAVETDAPIPRLPDGARLLAGLATTDLSPWPEGATRLPLGDVPASRHTDLLRCELRTDAAAVGWMQRAPVSPPLDSDRDVVALSSLMGFGAFQAWMRQLLSGDLVRDGGRRWDRHDGHADEPADRLGDLELLTLEDIVGAWGADKARFRRADAQFDRYCDALSAQDGLLSDEELGALGELRAIWRLARERLPA